MFESDALSAVRKPIEQAKGLPNAHYIDETVYMEERQALLFNNWAGLAVSADAPEVGDAVPIDFVGMPLLMVRGRDGGLRVFQNICRHRGMILVEEPRKIEGAIRCPYHSWCYGTDGRLVSTPHVGGPGHNTHDAIDRATLGLTEIRSHEWMGVVWVNVSGDAAEFDVAMADAKARWAEFEGQPLYHGGDCSKFTLKVKTNWKLAVENYCESYHLPWVHPGLNSYSRLEDHYNIENPGAYLGQGTLVYRQLVGDKGNKFPDFTDLSDKWDEAAEYLAVYPNVLLGVHRDHSFAIILMPHGVDETHEHIHLFYPQADVDADMKVKNAALWKTVFEEDVFVVEGMQRGRQAVHFDGGRFSPAMDGPTHCFHDWVASQMQAHRTPAAAE